MPMEFVSLKSEQAVRLISYEVRTDEEKSDETFLDLAADEIGLIDSPV